MTVTNTLISGSSAAKGFGPKHVKSINQLKWSKEVKTFLDLFAPVMEQTRVPRVAMRKYIKCMRTQLLNRGAGYLAQTRNYPIFGLRILGGDLTDERSTRQMFKDVRMKANADGIELPVFLGWYWNRLYYLGKVVNPTKEQALEVSRILAVLSFSKFLMCDSKMSRIRAENSYDERLKNVNGKLIPRVMVGIDDPLYDEMVAFLKRFGHDKAGKGYKFDRRCYSLKALTKSKPHRPPVPPAYGYPDFRASFAVSSDGRLPPNNLVNVVQRYYYDSRLYDAKACVIVEAGGKYRGICPYVSPYAHSINLYREAKCVLDSLPGNCNYDQEAGHLVARSMSSNNILKVSSDASNFTDTINIGYAASMADALGSSGAVHYHSQMRIRTCNGEIVNNCVPLMGWKGTFDLASVLLAFSVYRTLGLGKTKRVQCGDDLLGYGTLEQYQEAYEFIGCKLSIEKTVVSRSVTIFCGEMYWKGLEITPIRFLTASLSLGHRFVGKLINRTRDFVDRCNYSSRCKRKVYKRLKKILGERYGGYLDFRLSSDLGGIPLNLHNPVALVPYLENRKDSMLCALCNLPFEKEEFDGYSNHFAHLPLGKTYNKIGIKVPLTPGSWPTKVKLAYGRRKRQIIAMMNSNRVGIEDVLLYIYDGTMLKP